MIKITFELSQLRCFVTAAEELHFGRAARRLNMTQPPLSRQIQLLERALGVSLLARNCRLVELTPAGRTFVIEARRILRLSESATLATRRVATGQAGSLTIGFTAAAGYSFVPHLIEQTRAYLPEVDLSLREMVSHEQIEALLAGRIDIGLFRPPIDRQEFSTWLVSSEGLMAAVSVGDPRAERSTLRLSDFDRLPFIMYSSEGSRYFHDLLISLFNRAEVLPDYVQSMTQIHSMLALVKAGLGAAIVPEAATSLNFDGVTMRRIQTEPQYPVELHMAWRKDHDNPVLEPFVKLMREKAKIVGQEDVSPRQATKSKAKRRPGKKS